MLGISTCWWDIKLFRGDEIIRDIIELGFDGVELEYGITNPGNYGDKGSGDLFLLSSTDKDERSTAVKYSIRTIEHASDLDARAVILHLGHVDMPNPIERFRHLYISGKMEMGEGLALMKEQRRIRKARCRKNLDAVLFSLDELNREAEQNGVFLGIENRYYFHEIPDFEEIGTILNEFKGGNVRYWHDVGHARVQENLGLLRHSDLLDAYSKKMIGIHLHDVRELDDHFSPGMGEIDFGAIKPFMASSLIQIMEVHSKVERKELQEGIRFIKTGSVR